MSTSGGDEASMSLCNEAMPGSRDLLTSLSGNPSGDRYRVTLLPLRSNVMGKCGGNSRVNLTSFLVVFIETVFFQHVKL